jgi:hypothetical protein
MFHSQRSMSPVSWFQAYFSWRCGAARLSKELGGAGTIPRNARPLVACSRRKRPVHAFGPLHCVPHAPVAPIGVTAYQQRRRWLCDRIARLRSELTTILNNLLRFSFEFARSIAAPSAPPSCRRKGTMALSCCEVWSSTASLQNRTLSMLQTAVSRYCCVCCSFSLQF